MCTYAGDCTYCQGCSECCIKGKRECSLHGRNVMTKEQYKDFLYSNRVLFHNAMQSFIKEHEDCIRNAEDSESKSAVEEYIKEYKNIVETMYKMG